MSDLTKQRLKLLAIGLIGLALYGLFEFLKWLFILQAVG